jgi:fatty-acyl-CoA synthase
VCGNLPAVVKVNRGRLNRHWLGAQTDEAELREFARANLAHFKAPHSVTFVKELPKTATGKIQKYILRSRATAIAPQ